MSTVFALCEVPPLPAHGCVDPLTLRIKTRQPRALAEEILSFFRGLISGAIKVNSTKCTIRAELIMDYNACVTKVRMYSGVDDIVLVEFLRRSSVGGLANGSVFLAAQRHLTLRGYLIENPSPMHSLSLPPPMEAPAGEVDICEAWQMTEGPNDPEEGALMLWRLSGKGVDVFCCPNVVERCLQLLDPSSSFGTRYAAARLLRAYTDFHFDLWVLYSRRTRELLTAAADAPPASVGSQLAFIGALIGRRWLFFVRAITALVGNRVACIITEFLLG